METHQETSMYTLQIVRFENSITRKYHVEIQIYKGSAAPVSQTGLEITSDSNLSRLKKRAAEGIRDRACRKAINSLKASDLNKGVFTTSFRARM